MWGVSRTFGLLNKILLFAGSSEKTSIAAPLIKFSFKLILELKKKTKQFKKLGKTFKTIPNVQVIRLRRKSIEYDYIQQQTNRTPLERTFSWVVRGHMRKQWFASIGEHQPVWIAPHIKGNINMPLQNSQKMFVVDR